MASGFILLGPTLKGVLVDLHLVAVTDDMASNGYPFTSRRRVIERIASEPAFAVECVRTLAAGSKWMASHRSRAAKLIARLANGAPSPEDLAEAVALATPYARTLARVVRERELAERPDLLASAAVFGVVRPPVSFVVPTEKTTQTVAVPTPIVAKAVDAEAPIAKRRGRPTGSKNKRPRPDSEQPKRRRRSS